MKYQTINEFREKNRPKHGTIKIQNGQKGMITYMKILKFYYRS